MVFCCLKYRCVAVALWTLALFLAQVNAASLVFNAGFELDDAGYSCVKYLQPDTNPAMVYEGPQIETDTKVSGRRCLRIPNRFAEQVQIYSRDFTLVPGKSYTCSLWLKSETADNPMTVFVRSIHNSDWKVYSQLLRVGTSWKKHQFTFRTAADPQATSYHLFLRFGYEKESPAGDFWVDDIEILPVDAGEPSPSNDWEIALAAVDKLKILSVDGAPDTVEIKMDVLNQTDSPMDRLVNLNVMDDYHQASTLWTRPVRVSLKPHERQTLAFSVPIARYGAYRVEVAGNEVASERTMPGYFAVIGEYQPQPLDYDRDFCVGLNVSLWYRYAGTTWHVRKTAFKAMQWTPDEYFRLLSQMGCRLARDWGATPTPFSWYVVEPQQGKFDWSSSDLMLELCRRHGMTVMPVLGGWDFICSDQPDRRPGWPAWLKQKSRLQEPQHPANPGDKKATRILLPPIESWRQYVRAVAERYHGKISHYEIANEPNLYLYPAEYLSYLTSAFQEIKAASPQAQVVGFCSTGDYSGNVLEYMKSCFQADGLQYADIVSFHPYSAPDIASANPADKQIHAIQSLISSHTNPKSDKPLWNTECFFLHDYDYRKPYEEELCPPHENARRFLTDLGEGVGQSMSVTDSILWKNTLNPKSNRFGSGESFTQSIPSSTYVVYNALARFFEAAKPKARFNWKHESVCYVYEKNGSGLAAFWQYGDNAKTIVRLDTLPSGVRLYDLFGNECSFERQKLPIDQAPRYLVWPIGDTGQVIQALKQAVVESELPVLVSSVRPIPTLEGWSGTISVQSGNREKIHIKAGIQGRGIVGQSMVDLLALPDEYTTAQIPIKWEHSLADSATVKIMAKGRIHSIPTRVFPLASVYPVGLGSGPIEKLLKQTKGPSSKHQAQFQVKYDHQNVYIHVEVRDATPSGNSAGREPWQQDCIQLFIDPIPSLMPLKNPDRYHGSVVRLFVLPYAEPERQLLVWPGELKTLDVQAVHCRIQILPEGYQADLVIPWRGLRIESPSRGNAIGFDIAADDADSGVIGQLFWNSMGDAYKNRLGFGYLLFR